METRESGALSLVVAAVFMVLLDSTRVGSVDVVVGGGAAEEATAEESGGLAGPPWLSSSSSSSSSRWGISSGASFSSARGLGGLLLESGMGDREELRSRVGEVELPSGGLVGEGDEGCEEVGAATAEWAGSICSDFSFSF